MLALTVWLVLPIGSAVMGFRSICVAATLGHLNGLDDDVWGCRDYIWPSDCPARKFASVSFALC